MAHSIRAFVGLNGAGKTLSMVHELAIPAWERGSLVVANFRLYPERGGFDPALYRPLESVKEIAELRSCTLLLSEITACFPARQWASMAMDVARLLDQLRKPMVQVGWDGPTWSRCDKNLRDVTQLVTVCRGSFPDPWVREPDAEPAWRPPKLRDEDGKPVPSPKEWPSNRLIRTASYRREDFDEFETGRTTSKLRPYNRSIFWRPRSIAARCYDTSERVSLLDHLENYGATCLDCGGARSKPKCQCPPRAEAGHARPEPVATGHR